MLAMIDQGRSARAALLMARHASALVDHAPSAAQKAAGNYRKEHISFQGLPLSIENKKGSARHGIGPGGKPWACVLPADYGYIKKTVGADQDHVDVFVGPDPNAKAVFVINQHDHRSGAFDEHKAMLGFASERQAVETYCRAFSDGKGKARIGSVETVSLDAFKHWLKTGRITTPASSRHIIDKALRLTKAGGGSIGGMDASMLGSEGGSHVLGSAPPAEKRSVALTPYGWEVNGTLGSPEWTPEVGESVTMKGLDDKGYLTRTLGQYRYMGRPADGMERYEGDGSTGGLPGAIHHLVRTAVEHLRGRP